MDNFTRSSQTRHLSFKGKKLNKTQIKQLFFIYCLFYEVILFNSRPLCVGTYYYPYRLRWDDQWQINLLCCMSNIFTYLLSAYLFPYLPNLLGLYSRSKDFIYCSSTEVNRRETQSWNFFLTHDILIISFPEPGKILSQLSISGIHLTFGKWPTWHKSLMKFNKFASFYHYFELPR